MVGLNDGGILERARRALKDKAGRILEEEHVPFAEGLADVLREYGVNWRNTYGFFADRLIEELKAEGVAQTMPVVEKFFETLEIPISLARVERALQKGGNVTIDFPYSHVDIRNFEVTLYDPALSPRKGYEEPYERLRDRLTSLPQEEYPLRFYAAPGLVGLTTPTPFGETPSGFYLTRERAFFLTQSEEEIESALRAAKNLEPLLSHIGLEGMASALKTLKRLERGEALVDGDHVLARGEDGSWRMRRGPILGDPELDKEALLGKELSLIFPGDVEIAFRCTWTLRKVYLEDVRFRLEEDFLAPPRDEISFHAHTISASPIEWAIHGGLRTHFAYLQMKKEDALDAGEEYRYEGFMKDASPRMVALLWTLAERQYPFSALVEGRLAPHVKTDLSPDF